MDNPVQRRAKAAAVRSIVLAVVGFYQRQYDIAKIAPTGARWRELRFSFPRHIEENSYYRITVDDCWDYLYHLVRVGVVKEYQTLFRPRYVIDYAALRAYEKKWNLS